MSKKVASSIHSYIEELKKNRRAPSTFVSKKRHLLVFKDFLQSENLNEFNATDFKKKHYTLFNNFLKKRKLKDSTRRSYLSTISAFLEYLESPDFLKKEDSDVQKIVNYYFETKGYSLEDVKESAKKKKIIYSRYTRPAKDLLELAGSFLKAKKAIDKVSLWAKSRNLDYVIETVIKKWPEINKLKPKEKKMKPYYYGDPMMWSNTKQKWFVISKNGDWLEYAGKEKDIEWREE